MPDRPAAPPDGEAAVSPAEAAAEALDPTAPGQPPESGVLVDLPAVVPETGEPIARLVRWGCGTAVAFTLVAVAVGTHWQPLETLDQQIHQWVVFHRSPWNVNIALFVTWAGSTFVALPALVVVGAVARPGPARLLNRIGSGVLLAGIASLGIYLGLLVNRLMGGERPLQADWSGTAGGPTFPSGHTTTATVFAACCVWALSPRARTTSRRRAILIAAVALAGAVGWSRVWLGVHWPSDVLGGWLFGVAWVCLAAAGMLTLRRRWPRLDISGAVGRLRR